MPFDAHKNLAISAVATAPSPATTGTSLVVTAGHGTRFPAVPFNATIWPANTTPSPDNAEIVRVTNISTDTLTITREQESTSARTVIVGDQIAATITAKTLTDVEADFSSLNASNLASGTVPDARFPATLPAASGANLTALNASNVSSGTLANARLNTIVPPTVVTLTDGATPALDASLGNVFLLTAAASRTIAVPTNPTSGQKIIIAHKASGGGWTLSLNTGVGGFRFGTDVTGLTATTSAKTDYIGCIYNSADNKWDVVAYSKGY